MTIATQRIPPDRTDISRSLMLIDGQAVEAADGRTIDIESPATRTVVAQVPRGGEADVERAVRAAARAFESWRQVPARERGRLLLRIADAMEAEVESIARIVALETGNAIRTQARPETKGAVDVFRYYGGVASEVKGETVPLGEHVLCYTRREPIGVVGGIVPWNAPVVLGTLKIAMSIAAGNTLVPGDPPEPEVRLGHVGTLAPRLPVLGKPDHRLAANLCVFLVPRGGGQQHQPAVGGDVDLGVAQIGVLPRHQHGRGPPFAVGRREDSDCSAGRDVSLRFAKHAKPTIPVPHEISEGVVLAVVPDFPDGDDRRFVRRRRGCCRQE